MALLIDYFSRVNLIDYELEDYKIHKKVFNRQQTTVKGRWSKVNGQRSMLKGQKSMDNSQKKCTFAPPKRMDRQK
jgi:hypothetical protein